jgi:hypothetical protein
MEAAMRENLEIQSGLQARLENTETEQESERRQYVEHRLRQLREWHEWMLDVRNFNSI